MTLTWGPYVAWAILTPNGLHIYIGRQRCAKIIPLRQYSWAELLERHDVSR